MCRFLRHPQHSPIHPLIFYLASLDTVMETHILIKIRFSGHNYILDKSQMQDLFKIILANV